MRDLTSKSELLYCRVCGLKSSEPPWGLDGATPLFEFCPCCGVESGSGDATVSASINSRKRWISEGAKWFMPDEQPKNWNLQTQLAQVPEKFKEDN